MQDPKMTDLESYRASLHRRIQVSYPNIYTFLTHIQNATVDCMTDWSVFVVESKFGGPRRETSRMTRIVMYRTL